MRRDVISRINKVYHWVISVIEMKSNFSIILTNDVAPRLAPVFGRYKKNFGAGMNPYIYVQNW